MSPDFRVRHEIDALHERCDQLERYTGSHAAQKRLTERVEALDSRVDRRIDGILDALGDLQRRLDALEDESPTGLGGVS